MFIYSYALFNDDDNSTMFILAIKEKFHRQMTKVFPTERTTPTTYTTFKARPEKVPLVNIMRTVCATLI